MAEICQVDTIFVESIPRQPRPATKKWPTMKFFRPPVYPKDLDLRLGFAEAYNNQSDRRGGKRRQSATVAATAANVAAASLADYAGDEERPFR
jgi:hypothetical protein